MSPEKTNKKNEPNAQDDSELVTDAIVDTKPENKLENEQDTES